VSNVFNISTSALTSLQRAIATTGHNIANVNTEGFSRQRVEFEALPAQISGAGFIGSGVTIGSITRSYDEFLAVDVRTRTSAAASARTAADLTGRIDSVLADPNTGLSSALDRFFAAVQDVANNPGSLPERQILIREAEVLGDRFSFVDGRFGQLDLEINTGIRGAVEDVNNFAVGIAALNEQIVSDTNASGGQPPNDLLDARDQLLNRLAEKVGISTFEQDDGAVNVFLGNGQALVVGTNVTGLETFSDPTNVSRLAIGTEGLAVQSDISRFITGGELGALIGSRSNLIDGTRNQLNVLAAGIATSFNQQSRLGLDLDGRLGGDFFRPLEPSVVDTSANADLSARIVDPSAITGDQYELSYAAGAGTYTLRNLSTGATEDTFAAADFPRTVAGLELDLSLVAPATTPADGDSFRINPVFQAASLFEVQITDPRSFAAASPLRSSASLANIGSGTLGELTVNDVGALPDPLSATPPIAGGVTLEFRADTGSGDPGFVVVSGTVGGAGLAPIDFDPTAESGGKTVTLGGFSFELAGIPSEGDRFTIELNTNGSGDNRNALALAELQLRPVLNNGNSTFQDAYAGVVADVAVSARQAGANADTEETLLQQALNSRDALQGANLDEEAANLLRYQQAYQAAARAVQIADEVFQTLLAATGG
jgi:flagellar hook-associated protein 1 FlgK